MTRRGQLTVIGTQWDESGEAQTTRVTAAAEYYDRGGSSYILYEENAGGGKTTKNIIKFKGRVLELTKKGAVNACMVFEPGREYAALYATPFGSLPLGILTDTVECALTESGLQISAAYALTTQVPVCQTRPPQNSIIARCKILIKMEFEG